MKSISIHNYEVWFVDFKDGLLTQEQINELMSFLNEHPELKEEFKLWCEEEENILTFPVLSDDAKQGIAKEIKSLNQINEQNYEQKFFEYVEGDLNEKEAKEVLEFLILNPGLEQEFKIHTSLKLSPDKSIIYREKETLYKKPVFVIWKKVAMAVAAACVLILITVLINDVSRKELPLVDSGKHTDTASSKQVISVQNEFSENELIAKNEEDTIFEIFKKSDLVNNERVQKEKVKVRVEVENKDSGLIKPDFPVLAENNIQLRNVGIIETKIEEREYHKGKEIANLNDFVLLNETLAPEVTEKDNVLTIDKDNIGGMIRQYIADAADIEYKSEKSVNGTNKLFFRMRGFSIEKK